MSDRLPKNRDAVLRFAREIATINVHLEELRYFWAKRIGISGPQWMILMAISELDQGEGVAVNAAAKLRIPTNSPRRTDMKSPVDSETMSPTFPI